MARKFYPVHRRLLITFLGQLVFQNVPLHEMGRSNDGVIFSIVGIVQIA